MRPRLTWHEYRGRGVPFLHDGDYLRRLDAWINRSINCHARFTCHLRFRSRKEIWRNSLCLSIVFRGVIGKSSFFNGLLPSSEDQEATRVIYSFINVILQIHPSRAKIIRNKNVSPEFLYAITFDLVWKILKLPCHDTLLLGNFQIRASQTKPVIP